MNPSSIAVKLLSGIPELEESAFEEIRSASYRWAEAAVALLQKSDNPFLVAERLPLIGTSCINPLKSLLIADTSKEVRILAALVLLKLGDVSGINEILTHIRKVGPYANLAVGLVSNYSSTAVADAIIEGMGQLDVAQFDFVVAYVLALRRLGTDIPSELVIRFRHDGVPWQITSLFDTVSPDSPPPAPRG